MRVKAQTDTTRRVVPSGASRDQAAPVPETATATANDGTYQHSALSGGASPGSAPATVPGRSSG